MVVVVGFLLIVNRSRLPCRSFSEGRSHAIVIRLSGRLSVPPLSISTNQRKKPWIKKEGTTDATDHRLLPTAYCLLATGYWLLATGYCLLATAHSAPPVFPFISDNDSVRR